MKSSRTPLASIFILLATIFLSQPLFADMPQWIWHDNKGTKPADGEVRFFRKTFNLESGLTKASLVCATDDEGIIYVNGVKVAESKSWSDSTFADITANLKAGENVVAVRGKNNTGSAGIVMTINLTLAKKVRSSVVTDTSWVSSAIGPEGWNQPGFVAEGWTKAISLGNLGVAPWGEVFKVAQATPAESLTVAPGFKVELVHSAQPEEGSWICMTVDQKGRLIISPQSGVSNLLRVTLTRQGTVEKIETIDQPVGTAMGLLYAFNSLYVNGNGPEGLGLYRLHYDSATDRFDSTKLLQSIDKASGEHGSHAVVLGPDKHIYIVSGNFTGVPKNISTNSPHRNFAEDQLLPRAEDGNGFGIGVKPPGGFLLQTDENGKEWKLFAAGMRNTYDFAFNTDGEMVAFDSDMEWDWGMPWYRPIRFCHLVSGGEYGFREGTGKWPKYYPDSLPSMVDVGVGSPTGVKFGTLSNFPKYYKKAAFALDWAYGRIFAAHLTPKGATYEATYETVLKGKPLNVTDLEFGHDGAMYFITGGRGTQSGLYRLTYVGEKPKPTTPEPTRSELRAAAKARNLRHQLETFQGVQNPKAIAFAWPYLDSDDRWIRYAARIAIESQPVADWRERALKETRVNASITALLALARCGGADTQAPLLQALAKIPMEALSQEQQLAKLRVIELSFIRQGKPSDDSAGLVLSESDNRYPAPNEWLNRELSELLIYLNAPNVVGRTLALLDAAPTQEEQLHYILHLRKLTTGWTREQHEHYFNWFNNRPEKGQHPAQTLQWFTDAGREYADGSSFPKFISTFRHDAIETLSDDDLAALAPVFNNKKPKAIAAPIEPRKFIKDWKMTDLQPALDEVTKGRSFARGKATFTAAQCIQCHRFANEGGAVGPELTAISSRFGHRDILESILEPSKVISEQYVNSTVIKKNGDDVTGRIVSEDDKKLVIVTNPLNQTKVEVLKADVQSRAISKISPMPEGLMSTFSKDEILDLIAYIESGGRDSAAAFQKSN